MLVFTAKLLLLTPLPPPQSQLKALPLNLPRSECSDLPWTEEKNSNLLDTKLNALGVKSKWFLSYCSPVFHWAEKTMGNLLYLLVKKMMFWNEHFGKWKCEEGPLSKSRKHSKLAEIAKYISAQFYYNCFCHLGGKRSQRRKISIQLYGSCEFFIYLIHNLFWQVYNIPFLFPSFIHWASQSLWKCNWVKFLKLFT